jgi:hypothetical protein
VETTVTHAAFDPLVHGLARLLVPGLARLLGPGLACHRVPGLARLLVPGLARLLVPGLARLLGPGLARLIVPVLARLVAQDDQLISGRAGVQVSCWDGLKRVDGWQVGMADEAQLTEDLQMIQSQMSRHALKDDWKDY